VAEILASGQSWAQIGDLALAFVLSFAIGLEREWNQKSAGLRTHTLVGVGSALFVLVSKYGFGDVLQPEHSTLDPSRVAAQVVSGIGFIGGGLIFVRQDIVRGLTTAAIVWVTCAIGMACGAGLALLAIVVTAGHFIVVFAFPPLAARLPRSSHVPYGLRVVYADGRGILRAIVGAATDNGFSISGLATHRVEGGVIGGTPAVAVALEVHGRRSVDELALVLDGLDGVIEVSATDSSD
jgi:putative Mg2+ transporter-C (MgtC) family protein